MDKLAGNNTAIARYIAYNLLPIPLLNAVVTVMTYFGEYDFMGSTSDSLISLILSIAVTAVIFGMIRFEKMREYENFSYILFGFAFVEIAVSSVLWSLFALPLFMLPPVLSIYYQNRDTVRRISFITLAGLVVSPLLSFIFKTGTFYPMHGIIGESFTHSHNLASVYAIMIPEVIIFATIAFAVVTVALHTIRTINYQRNLANTIAKDDQLDIYNKSQFQIKLKHMLSLEHFNEYCIMATDIIKFRLYNDLFGHSAGDDLLRALAESLEDFAGEDGIVGRLGDDHLVCLFNKKRANEEEIRRRFFRNTELAGNNDYTVDVACGIYEIIDRRIAADIMCDSALMAVQSKKAQTEGVAVYRESMLHDERKSKEFLNELNIALEQNQFVPYFQAQCTADGTIVGAEVLSRWKHPERGIMSPDTFVPLCEENGLISQLDRDIWDVACRTLSEWDKMGFKSCPLSVNISPVDIYEMDVFEVISETVKRYEIDCKRLRLEITESAMKDSVRAFDTIRRLRKAGFVVSIDDFGSGYSSLGMLSKIDVDIIKLDMTFLRNLDKEKNAQKILEIMEELAKKLEIGVVVEGVENENQLKRLSEMGYEVFQGYYFSRPIGEEEFVSKFLK